MIARERRNVLNSVESHPHYTFAVAAISNALYGDSAEAYVAAQRGLAYVRALTAWAGARAMLCGVCTPLQ